MGNWEYAGVAAHVLGLPHFIIVARQSNPLTDDYLNRMRAVTGIELIWRDTSALKRAVRNIREGKVMTFMTDMRSRTPAVSVQFLGKPANVAGGLGAFARMSNVPVFIVVTTRVGWTRHRWQLHGPIHAAPDADKDADAQRMTQHVLNIFDKAIREEPEQYFWYNKRWVLDPLEGQELRTQNVEHRTSKA
jgi:KDO2-lipid IV(A) lauroyltransferase